MLALGDNIFQLLHKGNNYMVKVIKGNTQVTKDIYSSDSLCL